MDITEKPSLAVSLGQSGGPRGRSTTQVADFLRSKIISGDLPSGERINEKALTAVLTVSRTPLREALKILQSEGLVDIKPNRGAWVAEQSIKDVSDTIDLLVCLEANAAQATCASIDDSDMSAFNELHKNMVLAFEAGDLMAYFKCNQAIHQKIVDGAGNSTISRVYRLESTRIQRFRYAGNELPSRWSEAVQEHEQILAALKNREPALLREIIKFHHRRGWHFAREVLSDEAS